MQLNDKQRKIIEDSMWIINTVLKKNNLTKDLDLKQTATLYMCKCLLRFDDSKNVKWSTYAYKSLSFYIKRVHAREQIKKSRIIPQDVFDVINALNEHTDIDDEECYINDILSHYDEQERVIIKLKLNGFNRKEICKATNMSVKKIGQCMASIGEKYKEIVKE